MLLIFQGGLTLPTRDHYLQKNYTQIVEALKKVAVRIVKLLITDSFEEGSEVLIDAQWLGRIREEIEEVKEFAVPNGYYVSEIMLF